MISSEDAPTRMLDLLLDEYFDLLDAIEELEARRDALRSGILALMRDHPRHATPRGTARILRYGTFDKLRPSRVLPVLAEHDWLDETLVVQGRPLYRMATLERAAWESLAALGAQPRLVEQLTIQRSRAPPRRVRGR